jgi:ATP phosphoribosyltransferase regulatory subunit
LGCDDLLDDLATTWKLLVAAGVSDRVVIDFSVMRAFDYYTGLVVEAFAPGLGLPLGGGGRYDGVLGAYDSPLPAAGFALGLERVMIALVEQGVEVAVAPLDAVVGGESSAAIRIATTLRAAGKRVVLSALSGEELAAEATRLGALEAIEAGGERS